MKIQYFALLLLSASVLASCTSKEEVNNNQNKPAEVIGSVSFTVGDVSASGTRSEADVRASDIPVSVISLDVPGCGESFSLVETVSSMDDGCYGASSPTRATPVEDDNFDSQYESQLYGTPYAPGSKSDAPDTLWHVDGPNQLSRKGTRNYEFKYAKDTPWPKSNSLVFFLQAPYDVTSSLNNPTFKSDGTVTFGYSDPGLDSQKDLLFASSVVKKDDAKKKDVIEKSVTLYHALAAVKFSSGNTDWDNTDPDKDVITKITKVKLKDVNSSGTCTLKTGSSGSGDSGSRSTWSGLCTPKDYELVCSSSSPLPSTAGDGQTLLLIPQSFAGKQIDMEFIVVKDGEQSATYSCSVTLPSGAEWKAGEMHAFSLVSNRLEVTVTLDNITNNTVKLSNTGNVPAYVRAAYVVGYAKSQVCVPAADATGCFTGLGTGDWIEGSDGFYYYKYPVKPGCSTASLYTKFTEPTAISLVEGAAPQLSIILQGVPFDEKKDIKTTSFAGAWGSVTLASSSETVLSKLYTVYKN